MMAVSTLVDKGRVEGGGQKNAFHAYVLRFEPGALRFSLCERSKFQHLGQNLHDKASSSFF